MGLLSLEEFFILGWNLAKPTERNITKSQKCLLPRSCSRSFMSFWRPKFSCQSWGHTTFCQGCRCSLHKPRTNSCSACLFWGSLRCFSATHDWIKFSHRLLSSDSFKKWSLTSNFKANLLQSSIFGTSLAEFNLTARSFKFINKNEVKLSFHDLLLIQN